MKIVQMKKPLHVLIITLATFAVYYLLDERYFSDMRTWFYEITNQFGVSHIIAYAISGIPLIIGALLMHKPSAVIDSFGLNRSFPKAIAFSLICTVPMLIGYGIFFDFNTELTLNVFLISGLAAAFFEELFFRGFLYGQVYRYTNFGFFPSVIAGALLFASVHMYQSTDPAELAGIFAVTFMGGLFFAWMYSEWNHNIWVPVGVHFFMNIFWMLFSAGDNALGGLYANIFRVMTIVLVIGLTIGYKKKKGLPLEINRRTIWLKKKMDN
jgi:membrane protease YdiL (CAAX protease family)